MKNWFLSHNESPLALPAVWGIRLHTILLYYTFAESWNGYNYWMAETPFPFCQRAYIGIVMNALASMCLTMEFIE